MPKYIIKIKDTITYYGNIEMSEEEYDKLCNEDGYVQVNTIRSRFKETDRLEEEELVDFYPLY